ncbi:hypothetical protein U1Q18_031494 [Sarracenia purpurea var. burkii]
MGICEGKTSVWVGLNLGFGGDEEMEEGGLRRRKWEIGVLSGFIVARRRSVRSSSSGFTYFLTNGGSYEGTTISSSLAGRTGIREHSSLTPRLGNKRIKEKITK